MENLEKNIDEKLIYTLCNIIEQDNKYLIVTSTNPITNIKFELNDLKSRAKNFLLQTIEKPDDELIFALLLKNFSDRQISIEKNGNLIKGKVGSDIDLKKGQLAARTCCINIIAQLKKACNGNLDNVKSCIQIAGYVNSTDNFIDQPKVINEASELITEVFGNLGVHTRSAVSSNSLPLGAAVEIVSIFEIK